MEIKLKVEEVLGLNNTLKSIIDNDKIKINILLKYRLLGVMQSIKPHITNFEIIKNEKIMEYGKQNKDGSFQILKGDSKAVAKFKSDIEQVLKSDVNVCVTTFRPEEIFNQGLNSEYLSELYPIIKE